MSFQLSCVNSILNNTMCLLSPLLYSFDGLFFICSQTIPWVCCALQTHCIPPPTQPPLSWGKDSDAETPAPQFGLILPDQSFGL